MLSRWQATWAGLAVPTSRAVHQPLFSNQSPFGGGPVPAATFILRPTGRMVGLSRFELLTPRLSSVCSNQLSYRPRLRLGSGARRSAPGAKADQTPVLSKLDRTCSPNPCRTRSIVDRTSGSRPRPFSRKEVIQPQVLLQLPCYDFTPITDHTLSACFPCGLAQRFLVQPAFVM